MPRWTFSPQKNCNKIGWIFVLIEIPSFWHMSKNRNGYINTMHFSERDFPRNLHHFCHLEASCLEMSIAATSPPNQFQPLFCAKDHYLKISEIWSTRTKVYLTKTIVSTDGRQWQTPNNIETFCTTEFFLWPYKNKGQGSNKHLVLWTSCALIQIHPTSVEATFWKSSLYLSYTSPTFITLLYSEGSPICNYIISKTKQPI